ncbi:MAG: hypothetical protein A3G52_04300 [Candidatus Taylorbacteria bacterium RIFCSPLOWO2_12_FULL_43_20]|uniref:Uncharacterized protein n=1 Tax=Candidatus Taylorbacteria bacterium RIFCSPLOWO2_12_FULL_43_20 TaxID=1802332 RepID=A0A1G2P012_9BACT|nr:MAG: hypothetical protein A3H58_03490 [Candidatus Taylorbacteria bacterium RIFCSPLOWO2_02_FULL_43_22b]OHA41660.1 MAG: hypothetical protein A3G52_04300 [Candidatus Taylorbacteria bacterium RIFCSPLOWO2_12_FULL_43_20]
MQLHEILGFDKFFGLEEGRNPPVYDHLLYERRKERGNPPVYDHLLYERRKERGNPPASGHLLYERRKKRRGRNF